MKNKKNNKIVAFLLLLLVITVGYALLSQTLDINGTTNIKSSNWSIIWDNVVVNENSVKGESVTTAASITNAEKTLVEYSISLSEPREFYEFTVDAKNEGTIDGMVNVVSNKVYESNGTTEKTLPEYLTYTVTYSDGKAIEPKHLLSAGSTEKYKVRVEFKDVAADKLPSQNETLKFKFEVEYVQADDTAQAVDHGLTGTRYTTNLWTSGGGNNQYVWIGQKPTDNITLYETAAEARDMLGSYMYLKHEIENDIVKKSYVCFSRKGNIYCLQGGVDEEQGQQAVNKPVYDANKAVLESAFESNQCYEYDNNDEYSTEVYFNCNDGSAIAHAYPNGYVRSISSSDRRSCNVDEGGSSSCNNW